MINILGQSIYYQLLIFFRVKQAVFFILAFPVFVFIIFGSIWGNGNPGYISFLLTGVMAMTIASEGLFSVGPIIREYYANGLIKYLRKLPFSIVYYFSGLIVSRIISMLLSVALSLIAAALVFGYTVSIQQLPLLLAGCAAGLFIFSFIGLAICYSGVKQGADRGIINFVYFIMLFTSDAYYPASEFNAAMGRISDWLPLNQLLKLLRGEEDLNIWLLLFWLVVPAMVFYYLFRKIRFQR